MSDLTVKPWKRNGQDRLYVNLGRTAVAWADRSTNVIKIEVEQYRHESVALLRPMLDEPVTVRPPEPQAVVEPRAPQSGAPESRGGTAPAQLPAPSAAEDLARNRPGAALLGLFAARGPSSAERLWTKLLRRPSEWNSWYSGLDGERRVGRELERLTTHGWRVLHGIPKSNGGDIDHLLIGPGGVFTINTKHHPGASVWVGDEVAKINGSSEPYPAASKREAAYVRRVLARHCTFTVPVEPVLVFVDVASLAPAETPGAVRVYQEREVSALGGLSGNLTPDQVEQVFAVARHQRVWLRP
ncbi:nuclease-related domain-containing protein [Streptomyces abikoensis]|uniref:nuclease-related domain-containing protein n=1 Tax=Streptomyces abikoensis TaxID=97398 RepID=UPI0037218703